MRDERGYEVEQVWSECALAVVVMAPEHRCTAPTLQLVDSLYLGC